MCPYYLDGDLLTGPRKGGPVGDTRQSDPMSWVQLLMQPREESVRGCVATVQFSRAVREGCARLRRHGGRRRATRSLKTQQHARARARRYASLARPGPVDMLGRTVGVPTLPDRSRTEVASGAGGAVPYGHRFGAP